MSTSSRNTDAVMVIVDISGYTQFVRQRRISLQHAEAIVTELIESIIDRATSPLVVNKLEGDAALLYAETRGERRAVILDVFAQLSAFFAGFEARLGRIKAARSHCSCDACANIDSLQLKAFLHVGEIVIKKVRKFEEIAGESVITIHRMTKNRLSLHEYILMTEAFHAEGGDILPDLTELLESIDGARAVLYWCGVRALAQHAPEFQPPITEDRVPAISPGVHRVACFRHLPATGAAEMDLTWWRRLFARRRDH
ncbi:MAG: DUF2652 domain-containing protein [Gammaproteobacteria bacterium]